MSGEEQVSKKAEREAWDRAWYVTDDEHGVLVMAGSYRAARAEGARRLEVAWEDVRDVSRRREFDQGIPSEVELVLKHGWHWECAGCLDRIDASGCSSCGTTTIVVVDDDMYCSARCAHQGIRESHRIEAVNAAREEQLQAARKAYLESKAAAEGSAS